MNLFQDKEITILRSKVGCIDNNLKSKIQEINEKEIKLVVHPGNAGDALIYWSVYDIFNQCGISFETLYIPCSDLIENRIETTFLLGGNFSNLYDSEPYLISLLQKSEELVILPSTFDYFPNFVKALRPNDQVFCRDKESFDRIKELKPVCKLNLSPDTAMSITTPRNLEIRQLIKVSNFSFSELRRIFYLLYHFVRSQFKSELSSLRTDLEGEKLKYGFRNKMSDLSLLGNTSKNSPEVTILFAQTLLFIVSKYRNIRTDRLHVAIASLIMGVENLQILDTPRKKLSNVFQLFLESRD